jgi:hypothetical protein
LPTSCTTTKASPPAARVAAANALLDRGYGKPIIGQFLDQMVPGQKPKALEKPKLVDTGYRTVSLGERPDDWLFY